VCLCLMCVIISFLTVFYCDSFHCRKISDTKPDSGDLLHPTLCVLVLDKALVEQVHHVLQSFVPDVVAFY
jgi:hypothetical protein